MRVQQQLQEASPPRARGLAQQDKVAQLLLEDGLHEGAATSWLHYPSFAAESYGIAAAQRSPAAPQVRLAYVEM